MILQKLHNEYGLNIEIILIKEYKKLGLTMPELNVLLVLLGNTSRKKIFSINAITKRTDYNQNEVAEIINNLLQKDFLTLSLEQANERSREIYSLRNMFDKLTNLLIEDEKQKLITENKSNIAETIELIEIKLARLLKANELDRIRLWYEKYQFDHSEIIKAINSIKGNLNVLYIEKLLLTKIDNPKPLDDKTEKLLDKIYKGL